MRDAVRRLADLGPLPRSDQVEEERLKMYEDLLSEISRPLSDDEARILVTLFGPDECYGLAWTLLHLVESAPGWPLSDCLRDEANEWIQRLRLRAERGSRQGA